MNCRKSRGYQCGDKLERARRGEAKVRPVPVVELQGLRAGTAQHVIGINPQFLFFQKLESLNFHFDLLQGPPGVSSTTSIIVEHIWAARGPVEWPL
jgi:hypothetical protein